MSVVSWNSTSSPNNFSSMFNNSSLYSDPFFRFLSPSKHTELGIWAAVTLLISLGGVVNNFLVLAATSPSKSDGQRVSSNFNLLISHYVAVNLVVCLFTQPTIVAMAMAKRSGYPVPSSLCSYVYTINGVLAGLTYWSDAGLAINRCVALFLPHHYKTLCTRKVNLFGIGFSWVVCCGAMLSYPLGYEGTRLVVNSLGQCSGTAKGGQYNVFGMLLTYLPYSIIGTGSLLMMWKSVGVWQCLMCPSTSGSSVERNSVLRRLKMAKLLLATFLFSALCTAPSFVLTNFPLLYVQNPVSILWLKTCL